jgi:hypothetical protein
VDSEDPLVRSDFLMCSYCRARFVPFFVPRGGITSPPARFRSARTRVRVVGKRGFRVPRTGNYSGLQTTKGVTVYIGGGALALIIIILLLIWIF